MKVKNKTKKDFDAVRFVREERDRIAKATEGKSAEEILAYFRKRKTQANNADGDHTH